MGFALSLEIGAAALVTWLTWRAATGTLARNDLAGVRTRLTMPSHAAWRLGHRGALRPTVIAGATSVLWCLVSMTITVLRHPISVLVAVAVLLVGALLSIPSAHRAVRRASSDHRPRPHSDS